MTRIFITGATGYIGRVLTELAVSEGYDVHGLSRSDEGDARLRKLGATPVRGELTTLDVLRRESSEADIVFHLAFIHDFASGEFDKLVDIDIAAVDALAEPLQGTDKPLVITSSAGFVQPDPNGGETDEDAPPAPNAPVQRFRTERRALAWAEKGVRVSTIRLPQYVYGRVEGPQTTGFAVLLIKLAAQAGESVYIDSGANRFSSVHVDDAVRLYLLVAKRLKQQQGKTITPGEVFNGTASTSITFKELATAIGAVLNVPVRSITRDEAEQRWGKFLAGFVTIENRASSRKAVQKLGWEPKGLDLLTEIQSGSYVLVAEKLREK
ncbi:hypothetical protein VTN96DRAFT_9860 [Rasamsonia emersonii]|uniref:NAD dependent epimerase/dehydratase n=1 Tax=Rasamsonia emersonii (strain ATCC 16479 / CBS 393.64 / IMI 116815) TaxID=1408163 RepID=A0A0F4YJW3_RASE3|nr:NAD dependent epimerase/dehydratase [Rasamsonia emersonii CBS 393.64]KKA18519.1 NAD dependent epimerase/dehydratase [Rasamsonia emersonii CBS 393.64]